MRPLTGGAGKVFLLGLKCVKVQRNFRALAVPCHQNRAERGQLERTRPEMAGLQGEKVKSFVEMVPVEWLGSHP